MYQIICVIKPKLSYLAIFCFGLFTPSSSCLLLILNQEYDELDQNDLEKHYKVQVHPYLNFIFVEIAKSYIVQVQENETFCPC